MPFVYDIAIPTDGKVLQKKDIQLLLWDESKKKFDATVSEWLDKQEAGVRKRAKNLPQDAPMQRTPSPEHRGEGASSSSSSSSPKSPRLQKEENERRERATKMLKMYLLAVWGMTEEDFQDDKSFPRFVLDIFS